MFTLNQEDMKVLREKGIKAPENVIIPVWTDEKTSIHLALDFTDNKVYVSQFMPYLDEDQEVEYLTLISSDKKFIIVKNDDDLTKNNLKALYMPNKIDGRWSKKSIHEYLNGKNDNVTIEDVFNDLNNNMKQYIDLPDEKMYDFLSCWAIGTYFHQMFNTFPYIYLNAMKRSGKTKLLTFMSCVCFNAKFSLSTTPATLFRLIQGNRCTLLMDEEEKITSKDIGEIRSMLLAGYKKGIKVPRAQEKSSKKNKFWDVNEYEVFSPKMIANISGIEDVLEDRCITLVLLRTNKRLIGNREIYINDDKWINIRDKLYINLLTNWKDIRKSYEVLSGVFLNEDNVDNEGNDVNKRPIPPIISEDINYINNNNKSYYIENTTLSTLSTLTTLKKRIKGIKSRDLELWLPALSIGLCVGEDVFNNILELCIKSVSDKETEDVSESTDLVLISVLSELVDKDAYYNVKDILKSLREYMGYEDKDAKWLNNRWVSRALKRLRFTEKRRHSVGVQYRITPDKVKEISERSGMRLDKFIKQQTLTKNNGEA